MPFCPIVACACLAKHKIIWPEKLTKRPSPDAVHCTRFQVHEDCTWHVAPSCGFIVIYVDALQLEVRVSMVGACWVNAMLIRDDFPELCTNLVTALTTPH